MGAGHHHHPDAANIGGTARLAAAVGACMLLSATGLLRTIAGVPLNAVAAAVGALPLLANAVHELRHRRLSADLAVCLAAGAAVAIGEAFVAAEVILIMLIGGILEDIAVYHTRGAIRSLLKLAPREATRLNGSARERVPIELIHPGDTVEIAPGERIPVDGKVLEGVSAVDRSALTGESLPVDVGFGSRVLAGSVNAAGVLRVCTERVGADTTFGRMVHLVEEAEAHRAPTQRLADRYAGYFLPVVLACAAAAYLWSGDIVRAVSVLVIACPCALVLATPTAVSAGIGRLARRGVLVKGGAALEALGRSRALLLDKTGTLTLGRLQVAEILPAADTSERELLAAVAAVEAPSEHPVGKAVAREAAARELHVPHADGISALPGRGIAGTVDGRRVLAGTEALLREHEVHIPAEAAETAQDLRNRGHAVLLAAVAGTYAGIITARDRPRRDARDAVARLKTLFPHGICILTGDSSGAAQTLADELGIHDVRSDLMPHDKTRIVQEWTQKTPPVTMVGDGVNDAAALATADIGIAVSDVGADIAVEAADIAVFGENHLAKLADSAAFARRVLSTVHQNIVVFALGLNALGVLCAALGVFGPVAAALLHQVGSLFVVANSLRLLWSLPEFGAGLSRLPRLGVRAVRRTWRPAVLLAAAGIAATGVVVIRPDEAGVLQCFGKASAVLSPGLHVRLPWPVTRLERLRPGRIRRIEIGFRAEGIDDVAALAAYEWNIQHRDGRYRMIPEESLMTCGDQSFLEVNAALHYRVDDPHRYLFGAAEPERILRALAEHALREVIAQTPINDILTHHRAPVETAALQSVRQGVRTYGLGVDVLGLNLQDVHPPLEVVEAFRQVVDALEEKDAAVNRAEAYRNEQVPIARGRGERLRLAALADADMTGALAQGEAAAFTRRAYGRKAAPNAAAATDFELYVDALESVLPSLRLTVISPALRGRRGLVLVGAGALPQSLLTPPALVQDAAGTNNETTGEPGE